MVQNVPLLRSSAVVGQNNVLQPNASTPSTADASCGNKRKNSRPTLKTLAAPKKHRGQSQPEASVIEAVREASQSSGTKQTVHRLPACNVTNGSSVAKSLFNQKPDSNTSSTSPKTPEQAHCSPQVQKMTSVLASSSISQSVSTSTSKESTPSKCSIISSKTVLVSPFKNECYYAVQKICCISSSPMKPSPRKAGKRDYVKGRLDFDDSDMPSSSEKPAVAESPSSSTENKVEDIFDFDMSDFDIDFSFAELLVNIDEEFTVLSTSHQTSS